MEEENYQCGRCEKTVPTLNRVLHSLSCDRVASPHRASPRTIDTENVAELTAGAGSAAENMMPNDGKPAPDVGTSSEPEDRTSQEASVTPESDATIANEIDSENFLVECEFCDLPVQVNALEAHSAECGARTDVCELCLNYVRLRDMVAHKDSGCVISTTGSAMHSALEEGEPLLGNPQGRLRVRPERSNVSTWTPVAVAVGAVAAAAAMSMLVRRR